MLKKVTGLMIVLMFVFSTVCYAGNLQISAGDPEAAPLLEITGGLNRESEITFDKSRTIVGAAPKNSQVTITVYLLDDDDVAELSSQTLTIGALGVFTHTVDLEVGENHIEIFVENEDGYNDTIVCVVKRKEDEIKKELEKGIVLPGKSILTD